MRTEHTTRDAKDAPMSGGSGPAEPGDASGPGSAGTPRWVKVSAVIAVVVVLLVVVMLLFGGGRGGHGPQRHLGGDAAVRLAPSGRAEGNTASSVVREQSAGHTGPPPGIQHGR